MAEFTSQQRSSGLFRLHTAFLNCDLGMALPETVFLPHPFGIVVSSGVAFGDEAIVGANTVVTKDVPAGGTVVGSNRLLPSAT